MRLSRLLVCVLGLLAVPALARAHWIWIYPDSADATKAIVVFSDTLAPDENPKILDKLANMKLWLRTADGDKEAAWTRGDKQYNLTIPAPTATVGGINEYGVVQKGNAKPFRLIQCTRLSIGDEAKAWDRLPIQLLATKSGDKIRITVHCKEKAVPAGVDIVMHGQEHDDVKLKTDDKGSAEFSPKGTGLVAFSSPYTLPEGGEYNGKKYEETRYSAALVISTKSLAFASPNLIGN